MGPESSLEWLATRPRHAVPAQATPETTLPRPESTSTATMIRLPTCGAGKYYANSAAVLQQDIADCVANPAPPLLLPSHHAARSPTAHDVEGLRGLIVRLDLAPFCSCQQCTLLALQPEGPCPAGAPRRHSGQRAGSGRGVRSAAGGAGPAPAPAAGAAAGHQSLHTSAARLPVHGARLAHTAWGRPCGPGAEYAAAPGGHPI